MRPANRYQTAIEILDEFFEKNFPPMDRILHFYFKNHRYIGSKDRQILTAIIYNVVRNYFKLKYILEKAGVQILDARTFMIASVLKFEADMPLEKIFVGEKYSPYIFTKAEKELIERLEKIDVKEVPVPFKYECSEEIYEFFKPIKDHERLLQSLSKEASFDFRVNPFLIRRETAIKQLADADYDAKPAKYSPFGMKLEKRAPIDQHDLFKSGKIEVQSEASQLSCLLVDAKPGDRVMDLCAGAGGKALLIAGMMKNKGELILSDISINRLERAKVRFRRAGFSNFQIKDAAEKKWFKRNHHKFDKVLVDAPCTGVGTWQRNPESRLRPFKSFLEELIPTQIELLDKAAKLVKPGGQVIYVTCSLIPNENEDQINAFLKRNENFKLKLIDSSALAPYNELMEQNKFLKTSPVKHQMDGFFGAILERID